MKNVQKSSVNLKCQAFWVMVFTLLTFGFQVSQVEAQQLRIGSGVTFVNGATVVVNGDSLVIRGTMKNNVDGLIELTGNLKNHGTFTNETGSIITLDGTNPQTIGGSVPTTFNTLNLGNSAGVTLAKDATVNGSLNFQTGILTTGSNLLTIAETGSIVNAAATRYVEGKLANIFSSADTKNFPIGKDGNYRPVSLQFSALTGTSLVTAEQFETALTGILPEDATLMTTSRHWTISQSGGSGLEYFVTLDATDYTPSRPVVILKQDAGTMVSCPTTAPDYTNSTALTTFSDFGLGEVCSNPADGGTLSGAQIGCGLFDPGLITGTQPSGHTGVLEYKWQKSTTSDISDFINIDNSNIANYDPDAVDTNTWFRRLARVDCKTTWTGAAKSSVVKIAVDVTPPVVVAKSGASVSLDPTGNYTLLPSDVLSSWSDAGVGIQSVTMSPPSVNCADLGLKTITVTVKDDCDNETVVTPQITVVEGTSLLPPWAEAHTINPAWGDATYSPCTNNGTFYLTSTGQSTTTNDVYQFVYQPLTGNGTIIARLSDVKNDGWAGVMMRESNAPNAKTILFKTRLYNPNVLIGYRNATGKTMTNMSQVYQLIRWMKIQRNGNTFQVFVSYNGTTWTRCYTATIAMTNIINAGIFTESYSASRTSRAWFDHVELSNLLKSGEEFAEAEIVNPENEQFDVQIYPNPATDEVNITLTGFETISGLTGTLLTAEGKSVKTFTINTIESQLDVQDLKPGLYILRFENEENVVVKRLVIQ